VPLWVASFHRGDIENIELPVDGIPVVDFIGAYSVGLLACFGKGIGFDNDACPALLAEVEKDLELPTFPARGFIHNPAPPL